MTLSLLPELTTVTTTSVVTPVFNSDSTDYPSGRVFSFKSSGTITEIVCGERTIHVEYTSPILGQCSKPPCLPQDQRHLSPVFRSFACAF